MARPLAHDAALRGTLLRMATEQITQHGHGNLVLRDVAVAAGTSTSAIYALFGGKAQLLTAVINEAFVSFGRSQQLAAADGMTALGHAYRDWALKRPALYGLMFGGALVAGIGCPPSTEVAASALGPLHARVVTALQRSGSTESARLVATAIWGQVHGLIALELARVPLPGNTPWDEAYEAALRGIVGVYGEGCETAGTPSVPDGFSDRRTH